MTNYSEKYFGKPLDELSTDDITAYFQTEKEESDKIEFKGYHKQYGNLKKNIEGVIRGVCGFLNSDGGILIWGAPIGFKDGSRLKFEGSLSVVPELIEKDAIISKLSDSISPLPVGIKVKILEADGGYVYVFEVQKSNYSPHQFKSIYYARLDGQTKPAPHYLVEALFNRITYPNIEGYLNFDMFGRKNSSEFIIVTTFLINFSPFVNEHDVSFRLICDQATFLGAGSVTNRGKFGMKGHEYINKGNIGTLHFGAPEIDTQTVIFKIDDLLDKHNGEIDFSLYFGGKKSPLKVSHYKLRLDSKIYRDQLSRHIVKKEENVLMIDKQIQLGTSRESLLKNILKR